MTKKKNAPRKKQKKGTKAKQVRREATEQLDDGNQDQPKKQVAIDENGRKMTVIMGREAEMDKVWDRMQMTFAIQSLSSTISERLEGARAAVNTQPTAKNTRRETFQKVKEEVKRLLCRMRDAINANNRQAA
ncbi:hypothetical protein COL5a_001116 [Colletotrichum fioriniae]|uniref:uncharacterized protein n=1 Tax=Colletotrichum fioriniae TaxID=710243 RepID=UPI002300F137|nr:uncharacterized protein COL516b_005799 [Colletotrichum fioriniae]KAJ0304444.1 hypothetical protein COL516b_005799 [Colletotrichum fioriniae]KAJ0333410.1 hypothetical protein COL5a_001116 [Colletotrichum fioriniae]KAJ3941574.1 hypothetical protein N0V96_008286 [Colletotrichum fioriniae]